MSRGKSDKIVYKEYNQSQQWLFPPSLDEDLRKSCSFKENCEGCPYRSLCTKSEYGRMVQRNENWLSHKKKVNEILHTEKYHELMKQRSSNAKQFLDRQNKKYHKI